MSQQNTDADINTITAKLLKDINATDKQTALLITDRKIYSVGETIYFKAFLIDSINNYMQSNPQKLYIDWVDKKDRVIERLTLNNKNFETNGRFVLPDSLPEGFYWLRAYTKSMLKSNIQNIAVSAVYVSNGKTLRNTNASSANKDDKPVLKIYPEGGNVISGLASTVAVSAYNQNGEPLMISGIIKDRNNKTVSTFTTNKYGLAQFSYSPEWFNRYKILMQHNNDYDSVDALPKTNFWAAQIAVIEQSGSYVTARVALEDSIYTRDFITYVIAVSKGTAYFESVGKGMYNVNIPLSKFPGGVATLYLLNKNGEILSSRDIYVKKENYHLTIQPDKKNYAPREKIKLNFKITDAGNQPEVASLNLSVAANNILDTSLSVFPTDTLQDLSQQDADLIMLTQNKPYPFSSDVKNIVDDNDSAFILSGKILSLKDEPINNAVATILSDKPVLIVETDTLTQDGKFKFSPPPYADKTQFTFQLNSLLGSKIIAYQIVFDSDSSFHFSTPAYLKKTFPLDTNVQSIKRKFASQDSAANNNQWLKPVTVKGYTSGPTNYDTTKRVSRFSHIITREMIGNGPGMAGNALLNVPGIRLMNSYVIVGSPNGFSDVTAKDEPLVVLDGVEMSVAEGYTENSKGSPVTNFLNSLPVQTIDFIEVLSGPEAAAYGMQGAKGVILVNTASKVDDVLATTTGLKSFYPKGFYNEKPFSMPDYTIKQNQKSKVPDVRNTIYWNGNIVTNKNGEASVEFFAADEAATYVGVVTGLSINGDKIYQTFTLSRN